MIKVFRVSKTVSSDAVGWLKENLGTEGVRWWMEGRERPTLYRQDGTVEGGGYMITLDVTDEEEPIVTAFVLGFVE